MKFRYLLALFLLVCANAPLWAADDDDSESKGPPPEEIPDFNHLDEYIYTPKSTLNYGFRYSAGIKANFSGNGLIASPEAALDHTTPDISRTYHDGTVNPDGRTMTVDTGDGISIVVPIIPDGKTNTWSYVSPSQITSDGFLQLHQYSAQTMDNEFHTTSRKGDMGWELTSARDMGRLAKRLTWSLVGGMSVNDIQSATQSSVAATLYTVTDTYNLYGQTPPAAPYTAPSTSTQTAVDQNGNPTTVIGGVGQTVTVDTTTLISSAPIASTASATPITAASGEVINHFKLHGSYVTFRGGPELSYELSPHLHLNISGGPALIYAGSQFTVDEVLIPATGGDIIDTLSDTQQKLLLGYYADATLQYDFTDRSGLYFGAFYQNAGSYNQNANTGSNTAANSAYGSTLGVGSYNTKVDFNETEGVRTGVSFRF